MNDEEKLIDATIRGDINAVEELFNNGIPIDAKDNEGWTPLMHAAAQGHMNMVEALLAYGADRESLNNHNETASIIAIKKGHTNITASLLFKESNINESTLKNFKSLLALFKACYADEKNPISCFISYAWGNQYTKIVQQLLVKDLRAAGFHIPIDVENGPGNNLTEFLDHVEAADFVVVVGSYLLLKKYRWKPSYDNEIQPVVKAELLRICGMANAGRYKKIRTLLTEGVFEEALPPALSQIIRIENFKQGNYAGYISGVLELVKSLYAPEPKMREEIFKQERETLPTTLLETFQSLIHRCYEFDANFHPATDEIENALAKLNIYRAEMKYRHARELEKTVKEETDPIVQQRKAEEVFHEYKSAVALGSLKAKACLAMLFLYGKGTLPNKSKAFQLLLEATQEGNGDITAMINLGTMYKHGDGIKKDLPRALFWFEKAKQKAECEVKKPEAKQYIQQKIQKLRDKDVQPSLEP